MGNIKVKLEREQILSDFGLSLEDSSGWTIKYNCLKKSAKKNGIECQLSFYEYMYKVVQAGITELNQIGRSDGHYQMARLGDVGDYTVDSCRFVTAQQNRFERIQNGGLATAIEKGVKTKSGRDKTTHEYLAIAGIKISNALKGRTAETHDGVASMALKLSKKFRLVDPQGVVHIGQNLKKFCRENNLSPNIMSEICRTGKKHKIGWSGEYVE